MRFSFHFGQICLYMGYSVEEQQRICRLLDQKGIWYDTAELDQRADQARLRGGFGERPDMARLYRVYVKQSDAEICRHLLQQIKQETHG